MDGADAVNDNSVDEDPARVALMSAKSRYQQYMAILFKWKSEGFVVALEGDPSVKLQYQEAWWYYQSIISLGLTWYIPPNKDSPFSWEQNGVRFSRFGPRSAPDTVDSDDFFGHFDHEAELDNIRHPYSDADCFVSIISFS